MLRTAPQRIESINPQFGDCSTKRRPSYQRRSQWPFNAVLKLKSSWLIEPVHHIVHLVSRRICVLPGELFARDARRTCVSSPFCNDKILVGARRNFVMDLIITYKVVCSRGDNEYWNRDMLKVIISGVVVRRHVEIVGALSPYRPY
jgi:hypothetical protein